MPTPKPASAVNVLAVMDRAEGLLSASFRESNQNAAFDLIVARDTVRRMIAAGLRVIRAFEAYGADKSIVAPALHNECVASMLALETALAALSAEGGGE